MAKVTDRTAVEVWMEVIAWLTKAADLGSTQIGRRPQHYCLGLGAELLAEKAVRLLPEADRAVRFPPKRGGIDNEDCDVREENEVRPGVP